MRRTIVASGTALLMLAAFLGRGGPARASALAVGAEPVVSGLSFPAAFTFARDGRLFYGERFTGEIRIYDPESGSDTLFFDIPGVLTSGEQGLLGLALSTSRPYVFAYATRNVGGNPRNQILRIRDDGGTGSDMRVAWEEDIVANSFHNGGRILFGPDRKLYAIVGEAENPANSQNIGIDAGKLLRISQDGQIPPDNPFPGNPVWAYGIRNSYGFTFDPLTGFLWETENGPECNDELNRIQKGMNYGWGPHETCSTPPPPPQNTNQDGPSPVLPQVWFTPTIAPTGIAFCVGCGISGAEGTFFSGDVNTRRIRRSTLSGNRQQIVSTVIVYTHSSGILSMERGPQNAVYFSDSSGIWKLVQN